MAYIGRGIEIGEFAKTSITTANGVLTAFNVFQEKCYPFTETRQSPRCARGGGRSLVRFSVLPPASSNVQTRRRAQG